MRPTDISRRDLLKAGGALVVSFAIPGAARGAFGQAGAGAKPLLLPDELDSWIAVTPHGSVTAFFGKMDMGQGVDVAIAQIVADELDVAFDRVSVVMGDTACTCNQGGARGRWSPRKGPAGSSTSPRSRSRACCTRACCDRRPRAAARPPSTSRRSPPYPARVWSTRKTWSRWSPSASGTRFAPRAS